eukprot:scaffold4782_cov32-Tisochrysis_lutea.AAC.2
MALPVHFHACTALNLSQVEAKPLACCDAATTAEDDLIVFSLQYADRVGENYFAKHEDRHRW